MSLLVNATSSHLRTTLQKRWNLSRPIFRLASLALRLLASSPRRVLTLSPSPLTRPTTPLTLHSSIGQSSCQLPPTTYFYLSFLILTPFPYLNTLSTMYPNLINIFVHATDTRTLTIARMTYPELPRTSCCCVLREPRSNLHRSVEIR